MDFQNRSPLPLLLAFAALIFCASCKKNASPLTATDLDDFQYPANKVWAHKANDTVKAHNWKERYPGLEVDVVYSSYQNELFVGHEMWDTILGLTLNTWFHAIKNPEEVCYWLDIKNLDTNNAGIIASKISEIGARYNTRGHICVENCHADALKIVHDKGLHVLYWVPECHAKSKKAKREWRNRITKAARLCHPIALSCSHEMYPTLNEEFPNVNIHYWNTPIKNFEENKNKTTEMSKIDNIKVILVDYE